MKYFIFLFLLYTCAVYSQNRGYFIDIDDDNIVDSIIIYSERENLFIRCNNSIVNLGAVSLTPIIRTGSSVVDFLFSDLNRDGKKELILSTDHPIFSNKTILFFISYKDSTLKKMDIDFGSNNIYDNLIVLDQIVLYDDEHSSIYCKIGNVGFNNIQGDTLFYDIIVLVKWGLDLNILMVAGEKYFLNLKNEDLSEIVF